MARYANVPAELVKGVVKEYPMPGSSTARSA
jgi:hypothetical protein